MQKEYQATQKEIKSLRAKTKSEGKGSSNESGFSVTSQLVQAGVGIKLAALPHGHILAGQYVVESVVVGGPAHVNHIDVGDVLIKVDGEETVGMSLSSVTSKLQVKALLQYNSLSANILVLSILSIC
jgi:C-terminal processing protease CtpA/Prc